MMVGLKAHTISIRFLLAGLFAVFLSCNGQKKVVVDTINNQQVKNPLTLLVQDNYAQTDSVETLVVRDEKSFRKFFAKINMTRKPGIPVPEVDFSKEMVLIYCAGALNETTMPELLITDESDKELVISLNRKNGESNKNQAPMVSPFSVYKMPITAKEITFKSNQ